MSFCTEIRKYRWLCTMLLATLLNSSLNASEIFDGKFGVVGVHLGEAPPEGAFNSRNIHEIPYDILLKSYSDEVLKNPFSSLKLGQYTYKNNVSKSTDISFQATVSTNVVSSILISTIYEGAETYEECKKRAKSYALNFVKDEKFLQTIENLDEKQVCRHSYEVYGKNGEVARFTCRARPVKNKSIFNFFSGNPNCMNIEDTFVYINFFSEKLEKQYTDEINKIISLEIERRKSDAETKAKTNNDSINKIFQ